MGGGGGGEEKIVGMEWGVSGEGGVRVGMGVDGEGEEWGWFVDAVIATQ